ncbi:hypothetical protein LX32DRAFT_241451 [Colletotrichum zoysiae]|uniref:Uncharacterized protein n=1 Tax=Colletotrichum zoysiae TaxID=1216348 RepID=A0AAD9H3P4_9PEZI|nr:hypothetical protein LX32DRAFT_241451 [Colletotrichum zoysiae]
MTGPERLAVLFAVSVASNWLTAFNGVFSAASPRLAHSRARRPSLTPAGSTYRDGAAGSLHHLRCGRPRFKHATAHFDSPSGTRRARHLSASNAPIEIPLAAGCAIFFFFSFFYFWFSRHTWDEPALGCCRHMCVPRTMEHTPMFGHLSLNPCTTVARKRRFSSPECRNRNPTTLAVQACWCLPGPATCLVANDR